MRLKASENVLICLKMSIKETRQVTLVGGPCDGGIVAVPESMPVSVHVPRELTEKYGWPICEGSYWWHSDTEYRWMKQESASHKGFWNKKP